MIETAVQTPAFGEARDRELLKGASTHVYSRSPEGDLQAHVFFPPGHDSAETAVPVMLCFHSGMWDISAPTQFIPQCRHFAARGMVTVAVEYRVFQKHRTTPLEAIEDAQVAMGFVRQNAEVLGIDPARMVAMGASSGAHVALCAALHKKTAYEPAELVRPNALVLFSPVADTSRKGIGLENFPDAASAKRTSPLLGLPRKELPPCLIFHGGADRVVPLAQSEHLRKLYRKKKNNCELVDFPGADHSFFNYNVNELNYRLTLRATDRFLTGLGYLEPDPDAEDDF